VHLPAAREWSGSRRNKKSGADRCQHLIFYLRVSKLRFDLFDALAADTLIVEIDDIISVAAEFAGGVIFLEDDTAAVVGENFNGVFDLDVHGIAQGFGKHDAAKLVDSAYYSGGSHSKSLLFTIFSIVDWFFPLSL
jgi:hypothetical protein